MALRLAAITPRSVMRPVTYRAGVTSKRSSPLASPPNDFHRLDSSVAGATGHLRDFAAGALLDRNFSHAVDHAKVDGGRWQRHIEGHAIVMGGQRLEIGADLVADIALCRRPVCPDDRHVDKTVLHQVPTVLSGITVCGHAMVQELPGRQGSALITRRVSSTQT